MQPCNRICYSTVNWRFNMFRAAYRSSSGALTVFVASGLHTHVVTDRSQVWVPTQTWLRPVTTCVCKPEAANTVRAPDDERYAARNMLSPSMNGGIINSITRLHLVGYFYWVILRCTGPWILNLKVKYCQTSQLPFWQVCFYIFSILDSFYWNILQILSYT